MPIARLGAPKQPRELIDRILHLACEAPRQPKKSAHIIEFKPKAVSRDRRRGTYMAASLAALALLLVARAPQASAACNSAGSCLASDSGAYTPTPVVGQPSTSSTPQTGTYGLCNAGGAGCITLTPAIAGSNVSITIPANAGSFVSSATSPLSISSGVISLGIGTGLTTSAGNLVLANPSASALGGVESYAAVSHQWINQISTGGVPSSTQPAFGDISGQATLSQFPNIAAGTVLCNPTGSSAVPQACWAAASNSVESTGLNGIDNSQFFIYWSPTSGNLSQPQAFWVKRVPNYSGGTNGTTQSAIIAEVDAPSGDRNYEWGLIAKVINNSTTADGSQNVGGYFQAFKQSTGATWGGTTEARDTTGSANPTAQLVTHEFDILTNGTDNNNTRVINDLWAKNYNSGTAPTVAYGIRINTDGSATIANGLYFNTANFTNFINTSSGSYKVDGSGNITANSLTLPQWTTFNPNPGCNSGTATFGTPTGRYQTLGKTTFFVVNIPITTANTCSGVNFGTPNTSKNATTFSAMNTTTGAVASSNIGAGSFIAGIMTSAGGNAAVSGTTYYVSGVYENQ